MSCNWEWDWGSVTDCIQEGAESAWDWAIGHPEVGLAWIVVVFGCFEAGLSGGGSSEGFDDSEDENFDPDRPYEDIYGELEGDYEEEEEEYQDPNVDENGNFIVPQRQNANCGELISVAWEITKKSFEDSGEDNPVAIKSKSYNVSCETIDEMEEQGDITGMEAARLKKEAAILAGVPFCDFSDLERAAALREIKIIALIVYRNFFSRSTIIQLVQLSMSELSYSSELIQSAYERCPSIINEIKSELFRHFVRWGSASQRIDLPGNPPPLKLVEILSKSVAQQNNLVFLKRKTEVRAKFLKFGIKGRVSSLDFLKKIKSVETIVDPEPDLNISKLIFRAGLSVSSLGTIAGLAEGRSFFDAFPGQFKITKSDKLNETTTSISLNRAGVVLTSVGMVGLILNYIIKKDK